MPWNIVIVASHDQTKPLGVREEVIDHFMAALPRAVFGRSPVPSADQLTKLPQVLQDHYLKRAPQLEGIFKADGFTIQFYTEDQPILYSVNAEIRGNGNPLPALAAICVPRGWIAIDLSNMSIIELSAATSSEWEKSKKWRDDAIAKIRSDLHSD
jgi:hypothetical protein